MKLGGALGTVAITLALAAPASAATLTVNPAAADGCHNGTCRTIQQASNASDPGGTILILPGTYDSATFSDSGLTVSATGAGTVTVFGTLAFTNSGRLNRVVVRAGSNQPAIRINGASGDPGKTLTIDSSMLSGNGTGAGISSTTDLGAGAVTVDARHVTIADAGSAPALALTAAALAGGITVNLANSIVLGSKPASTGGVTVNETNDDNDDSAGHRTALFVDPGLENFLMRSGSPAIDQGAGPSGGETTDDVEGDGRSGIWDRGADEYVNHAPGTPGAPGSGSPPSSGGGVRAPDVAAPTLSITSPRAGQRLKRGRRAPVLRGRTVDATGVRAVELALRRFEGRRCRWYDGRRAFLLGSCRSPRFFRAVIDDFAWRYMFPRRIVPRVGRYELRARATDFLGNRTTAFSASSRTLAGFRIVR